MKKLDVVSRLRVIFLVCLVAGHLVSATPIAAYEPIEFGLKWDANTETDLDGYEIYFRDGNTGSSYRLVGEVYVDELEDPDNPRAIITNLYNGVVNDPETTIKMSRLADNGIYYFALTAFDTSGNISEFSEEICVEVKETSVNACYAAALEDNTDGDDDDGGGSSLEDLVDVGNLGCFISAADYINKDEGNIGKNYLGLYLILVVGLLGWETRKNIR
jgi:hypothetical protein